MSPLYNLIVRISHEACTCYLAAHPRHLAWHLAGYARDVREVIPVHPEDFMGGLVRGLIKSYLWVLRDAPSGGSPEISFCHIVNILFSRHHLTDAITSPPPRFILFLYLIPTYHINPDSQFRLLILNRFESHIEYDFV